MKTAVINRLQLGKKKKKKRTDVDDLQLVAPPQQPWALMASLIIAPVFNFFFQILHYILDCIRIIMNSITNSTKILEQKKVSLSSASYAIFFLKKNCEH